MVGHFSRRLSSILLNRYFNIDCKEDENNNNANSVYGEATCHWNYTILQNSHRKSGLFILKKGKPRCERQNTQQLRFKRSLL